MWLFQSLIDAAAVTSVTLGWWQRSKQKPIAENRAYAQLIALVLSTYLAVAFAILTEIKAYRAPLAIAIAQRALVAHVVVGMVSFVLAFFGFGKVRQATLTAALVTTFLWAFSNRIA